MKKLLFVSAFIIGFTAAMQAQDMQKSIGLRLGAGAEISFQYPLSNVNRLELDLGTTHFYKGFFFTGLYQWVFPLKNRFNLYAGVGPQFGVWNDRYYTLSSYYGYEEKKSSSFCLGIAGQFGGEYNFKFPLQVFVDYRPALLFVPKDIMEKGLYDFAMGARYRF